MLPFKRRRRQVTAERGASSFHGHLVDKVPVSEVCDEHGIQPSMFTRWRQQLPDDLDEARRAILAQRKPAHERKREALAPAAEAKLVCKDALMAELSEKCMEHTKELGEL